MSNKQQMKSYMTDYLNGQLLKRLQYRCFPVNIAKFYKNPYFEDDLQTAASSFLSWLL